MYRKILVANTHNSKNVMQKQQVKWLQTGTHSWNIMQYFVMWVAQCPRSSYYHCQRACKNSLEKKAKNKCRGSDNWSKNNQGLCVTNLWVEHGSADPVPCLDVNTRQTGRLWLAHRWSLQQSQTARLQTSPPLWPISSSMRCHWLVLQNRTKHLIT